MKALFDTVSKKASRMVTNQYSTSFSLGIRFLNEKFREPIYGIYGFVRFADEIVDSFHDYDKVKLLNEFKEETYKAIERKISLNPILNSFQEAVHQHGIETYLIETFLQSMEMDLEKKDYTIESYKNYILGSAEVVGLMCLRVFVQGDDKMYERLKPNAMSLGSAFQKINFLRDLHADYLGMGRVYFPNLEIDQLDAKAKAEIEADIEADFNHGMEGIRQLPKSARLGVYVAYIYYRSLFNKIKKLQPEAILMERIRIPNPQKVALFAGSYVRNSLNLL